MGHIILHAGMSKTGSSSIQQWLGKNVGLLQERGVHVLRIVQRSPEAPIRLVPAESGFVQSRLVDGLMRPESRVSTAKQIFEQIDAHAHRWPTVALSSEGYQVLFWPGDRQVLAELDQLANEHTVHVAYYVRPQHTWLETAWRQWGFRHPHPPHQWLERQKPLLRYLETLHSVREGAPRVSFEMRPFRADLLEGGDVVLDFTRVVLGLRDVPDAVADGGWSNQAFPLELSILLREAPPGLFWSSLHDNMTLDRLRRLALEWRIPASEALTRSRAILQRYCHRTFEPENQELIGELDWQTQYYVPPVDDEDDDDGKRDLSALDELWTSNASDAERELLFCALRELVSTGASSR